VHSKFGGEVKVYDIADTIKTQIEKTATEVHDLMYAGKTNLALKVAFELVNAGNKYFDDCKPWISIKEDEERCRKNIFEVITFIASIAKMCEPFIPNSCAKVQKWLSALDNKKDFKLPEVEILFKRLDMKEVLEKFKKYV
jgi:methionyl-tRNA synthetase